MGIHRPLFRTLLVLALMFCGARGIAAETRFDVSIPRSVVSGPVTGRLIIAIATRESPEPRAAIELGGPMILGVDLEQMPAGQVATVDAGAVSYPLRSLKELPAGEYFVQALLIRYNQVRRADGHTIWVPTEHRRQPFHTLPGNLYSKPQKLRLDPQTDLAARFELTETIPAPAEPKNTEWLRHVRIKSELLSKFWGKPIYLGATALLPRDYDKNPKSRYPTVYAQSHGPEPFSFNPDPASHERQLWLHKDNVQTGYEFYKTWISDAFPRFVVIVMEQPVLDRKSVV